MLCKDCWQYEKCNPPVEIAEEGCKFYNMEKPDYEKALKSLIQELDEDGLLLFLYE